MIDIINFAKLYTNAVDGFEAKAGGHNTVYIIKGEKDFVLRLSPDSHRSFGEIKSELDFMLYLKSNGAPLAAPIPGADGEYCFQRQTDDKNYTIAAFEIAAGEDYTVRVYSPERIFEVGKAIGKIHRLSKNYTPSGLEPRKQWHQNTELVKAHDIFKHYNKRLSDIFEKYMDKMMDLPKDENSFGLIHGDYMLTNYFFDENNITIIDFDNCEYSWFISDIAIWMVHFLTGTKPARLNRRKKEAAEYFSTLLKGYLTENTIGAEQIENIDLFFKMREYSLLSYNLERRDGGFTKWQKDMTGGILKRVLGGKPFIGVDFLSIYKGMGAKKHE